MRILVLRNLLYNSEEKSQQQQAVFQSINDTLRYLTDGGGFLDGSTSLENKTTSQTSKPNLMGIAGSSEAVDASLDQLRVEKQKRVSKIIITLISNYLDVQAPKQTIPLIQQSQMTENTFQIIKKV